MKANDLSCERCGRGFDLEAPVYVCECGYQNVHPDYNVDYRIQDEVGISLKNTTGVIL